MPPPSHAIALSLTLLGAGGEAPLAPRGAIQWTTTLPGAPARACVVDEQHVFQGMMRPIDGQEHALLVALERTTGRIMWQREVGLGYPHAAPGIVGALVVHGGFSGDVLALDRVTGVERWRFKNGKGGLLSTPMAEQTAGGERVWLGFIGGAVALDAATGAERLRVPMGAGTQVLAVAGGRAFLHGMAENVVLAVDAASGRELWRVTGPNIDRERGVFAGFQPEQVAIDQRALYLPTNVAETWAVDVVTGKKRWGYEPTPGGGSFGNVLGLGGAALFLSASDQKASAVARIDADTGAESWRRELRGIVHGVPVLVGDVVAVATGSAGLVAFGARDGEPRFTAKTGASWWGACGADGVIYVGHERRKLSAVR
ncbi:MAG: PQQ-like beta-propeller repeat protein [Deltaproteobacteria bacterium]|nr:PQQ-like beta-propeller repeat protein [Deltaproteobacteria bacterium]